MEEVIKYLEEIKEHQMQTVQLARSTKVYKLTDKALNIALHIHGVMESDCEHHVKYMGKDFEGFRICKKMWNKVIAICSITFWLRSVANRITIQNCTILYLAMIFSCCYV